jgi:hypothetical protein
MFIWKLNDTHTQKDSGWNLNISKWLTFSKWLSTGILHRALLKKLTEVSEVLTGSIIRTIMMMADHEGSKHLSMFDQLLSGYTTQLSGTVFIRPWEPKKYFSPSALKRFQFFWKFTEKINIYIYIYIYIYTYIYV